VFLHAAGAEHPLKAPCAAVLARAARNERAATTSAEVVQEVLHVLRRRGRHAEALTLSGAVLALFPDLLPVDAAVLGRTVRLLSDQPDLSTRDALHVATAVQHGCDVLVSVDAGLLARGGLGLRVVHPAHLAVP
jgi:hypothetical protein